MKILSNKIQRTIIALSGITFCFILFFIPYADYLPTKITYFIFLILGIIELNTILPNSLRFTYHIAAIIVGCFSSVLVFLSHYFLFFRYITRVILDSRILFFLIILVVYINIISIKNKNNHIFKLLFKYMFFLIYPGTFFSFILSVLELKPHPILHLFTLVFAVFIADGFSYLTGTLLHPLTSKLPDTIQHLSPKKTLAGYVGGTLFSIYFLFLVRKEVPAMFPFSLSLFIVFSLLLICSIFAGDMFESAIKRKLNIKNSGKLMLGRGGVLDSFDSLYFAAPTYYLVYLLFITLFSY